jgi:hexosaminidase
VGSAVLLQFGTDESYTLAINSTHATVTAPTQYGAMHGLETFFQLVALTSNHTGAMATSHTAAGTVVDGALVYTLSAAVPMSIVDKPLVRWRGLMIDTARHFLSVTTIKRAIDAMAASKMNNLHWHLTDDQSFPVCLISHPELCQAAAYRNRATGALMFYSTADIKDIVSYADARGVRVTPELDLPGHSYGLARGAPQVYVKCGGVNAYLPDPTTDAFFNFLDEIVTELTELFPDAYLHMGGDEINMGCWSENSNVSAWMKQEGYNNTIEALGYFQSRVQNIVRENNRIAMFWDEFWAAGLPVCSLFCCRQQFLLEAWYRATPLLLTLSCLPLSEWFLISSSC